MAWFMQDGASPHTAGATITFLRQLFRNRLIDLGTAHDWAPHNPDYNPLDYWFWGATIGSVYANRPATLDDLKQDVSDSHMRPSGKLDRIWIQDQWLSEPRRGTHTHIENVNYKDFV